ncbi:MAG: phage shock protein operon transcriptional activator [Proteobacteria bacterium]|nr:phage shock protein operon transcriptional activator [Pseudomonadota bacterium]
MYRQQESMVGNSAALALALDRVSQLAPINRPVIIMGDRGTGKELIAERLHFLSPRWDAPFLKVNCAAIAEQLLESELFGHEPGAFTGASRTHHGRFERADSGTLFLDELATMSTGLQEKLLRLIEYGEFERLGGQKTLHVDVRVITATNGDLRQLAREHKFREDLLDRLSFDVIHLPALSQRREDIPELAQHFAVQMCTEIGWEFFPGFTAEALASLDNHGWPGNVRELKNVVERSLYRWTDPTSAVGDVVLDPFQSPYSTESSVEPSTEPPPGGDANAIGSDTGKPTEPGFSDRIEALEKQLLEEALAQNGHNQRRTADALGLSYDQLRGMVRKYELTRRKRRS